jgi:hypothetical protein
VSVATNTVLPSGLTGEETGYTVPRDPADETGQLFKTLHG